MPRFVSQFSHTDSRTLDLAKGSSRSNARHFGYGTLMQNQKSCEHVHAYTLTRQTLQAYSYALQLYYLLL